MKSFSKTRQLIMWLASRIDVIIILIEVCFRNGFCRFRLWSTRIYDCGCGELVGESEIDSMKQGSQKNRKSLRKLMSERFIWEPKYLITIRLGICTGTGFTRACRVRV